MTKRDEPKEGQEYKQPMLVTEKQMKKILQISTYCSAFSWKVEEGIRSVFLRHVF